MRQKAVTAIAFDAQQTYTATASGYDEQTHTFAEIVYDAEQT